MDTLGYLLKVFRDAISGKIKIIDATIGVENVTPFNYWADNTPVYVHKITFTYLEKEHNG